MHLFTYFGQTISAYRSISPKSLTSNKSSTPNLKVSGTGGGPALFSENKYWEGRREQRIKSLLNKYIIYKMTKLTRFRGGLNSNTKIADTSLISGQ